MTILLKGITWDHPRGFDPLVATSDSFSNTHGNIEFQWARRSLRSFGESSIEELADEYDLLLVDHPFMGEAHEKGLLVPLEEQLSAKFLADQKANSVGPSFDSYCYGGHQYALPIDAAAQVAAYRPDLLDGLEDDLPQSIQDIYELGNRLPENLKILWPLGPTDCWCSLLSLCAQLTGGEFFDLQTGVDVQVGSTVLEELRSLLPILHEQSLDYNSIQALDAMQARADIAYVPMVFGYSSYAQPQLSGHVIRFTNPPCYPGAQKSSLLGGVGLAISARCAHRDEAAHYLSFVLSPDIQTGEYFANSGQPGHLAAWKSPRVNESCSHFFSSTLETLEKAYVRPRVPGFHDFQESAGALLHSEMTKNLSAKETMVALNDRYRQHCARFP